MTFALAAVTPAPPGTLGAFRVYDDGAPTVPVNLDVDDLTLTAYAVDVMAELTVVLDAGDESTVIVAGPTGDPLPAGPHLYDLTVTSGTLDLEVTARATVDVAGIMYGATIAGVEALVSNLTVTYSSNPSAADVTRWLGDAANLVASRIGNLDDLTAAGDTTGDVATFTARAAAIVQLLAGAYTEDAAHPDRITSQADTRYAAELERRAMEQLTDLEAQVAVARVTFGLPPLNMAHRGAGASFPPPLFRRDIGL